MQSLEIISINVLQILISLANLVILFLIIKKFLYKPVKKALEQRESEIKVQYENAEKAEKEALSNKEAWEQKMNTVQQNADDMIKNAKSSANKQSEKILAEARERADGILRRAESDAELEKQKAQKDIKYEIVDVSAMLTEKLLSRKLNEEEHHELINDFMQEIGDSNDGNK